MTQKKERRRHPRIKDKGISIKLSGEGFNTITQSLDVSASGIYCKVDRHVPVMTRVQVVLSLPGRNKASGPAVLNVDGVVVREHAVKKDGKVEYYDIAIFFDSLKPGERETLSRYIESKAGQTE